MTIPELIFSRRKALSLTQQRLGELCGYTGRVAERMVQQWEHSQRPVPYDKLRSLASALQIPLEQLIP